MGNAESSDSNPRFLSASRGFTKKKLDDLRSLFVSLAAQSQSNLQYITPSVFQIGGALSQHELEDWKLLYHSAINGLSFNTFLGNVSLGDGSTILSKIRQGTSLEAMLLNLGNSTISFTVI